MRGRPQMTKRPPVFDVASRKGRWVLPGSDPLPLASHTNKVARYGFTLRGLLDLDHPCEDLIGHLDSLESQPSAFGRLESWSQFIQNQAALRIQK